MKVVACDYYEDTYYKNPPAELINEKGPAQDWYFHGDLYTEILPTDQGIIYDLEDTPYEIKLMEKAFPSYLGEYLYIKPGVYPVSVYGVDLPCTGFFWDVRGKSRGLIVLNDDYEAICDAQEMYLNRTRIL